MQGNFMFGFAGPKSVISQVEAVVQEEIDISSGYLDVIKPKGFNALPGEKQTQLLLRTNASIQIRYVDDLFKQIVSRVPVAEAGCVYAILETVDFFRSYLYSKSESSECEEWDDAIHTCGGIIVPMPNGRKNPVFRQLLELYRHKPYNEDCTPAEPDSEAWKNWDYNKIPRTFHYEGETYRYDDGKVMYMSYYDTCAQEILDSLGYEMYDPAVVDEFQDEENHGETIWGWGLEEPRSFWDLPDYMGPLFTVDNRNYHDIL